MFVAFLVYYEFKDEQTWCWTDVMGSDKNLKTKIKH